ncbi:MAG: alternative ribosome rescue aminoacyl-tRNA hydrolase ArfB [Phycisphaerales bacterium]
MPPSRPAPVIRSEGNLELAPGVRVMESAGGGGAVEFSYSRSSGPGGQNVNKLSTKAELRVRPDLLPISPRASARLIELAGSRVTTAGEIILTCESHRSQSRNKSECLDKLREMLIAAMAVPKVRRRTKPSRGSKERRLAEKKGRSEIKRRRSSSHDD